MKSTKIVFFGSPEFAIPALTRLLKEKDFIIVAVVTRPDQPKNRGKQLSPTPIKTLALKHHLPVLEPHRLKQNFKAELKRLNFELAVVAAYGKFIPPEILKIPPAGFINLHPSLLPKYRGASPIQAAILHSDKKTGVTVMKMDQGLDTGDILAQKEIVISNDDTAGSLHDRLAKLGADLLVDIIKKYRQHTLTPQKQDDGHASVTSQIQKKDAKINWQNSAKQICLQIKAMNPWPTAWTNFDRTIIKISQAEVKSISDLRPPGTVIEITRKMAVVCGQGIVIIKRIKRQGKNWISGEEFLRGFSQIIGRRLF